MPTMNIALKVAFFEAKRHQVDVADEIQMHPSRMSLIIHGRIDPTTDEMKLIAHALKRKVEDLFPKVSA